MSDGTALPAWPYPKGSVEPIAGPTWESPGGEFSCHPLDPNEERVEHTIVLYDAAGLRMPLARVRVHERGQLLEQQQADASGELRVSLREGTQSVQLEWAPADLPARPELPYRKRYRVRLHEQEDEASLDRLANLGFSSGHSPSARVRHYQRAYHLPQTGHLDEVKPQVSRGHDRGAVVPFVPVPSQNAPTTPSPDASFSASFEPSYLHGGSFAAPHETAHALAERSDGRLSALGFMSDGEVSPGGAADPGSKGSAVPELGHLEVLVRDVRYPDRRHEPAEVEVYLQDAQGKKIEPSVPPEELHGWTWVSFYFIPSGRYQVIAQAPHRKGQVDEEVTTGSSTWSTVLLHALRRRRLSIFDFFSGFTNEDRSLNSTLLGKLATARIDDYSIVHLIVPDFSTDPVGVDWDPEFKVRGSTDEAHRRTYLEALIPALRQHGTQFVVGYSLVQGTKSGDQRTPDFLKLMEVFPLPDEPAPDDGAEKTNAEKTDAEKTEEEKALEKAKEEEKQKREQARNDQLDAIEQHAAAIVAFVETLPSIDGFAFDIELGKLKERHIEGLQFLMLETARRLAANNADLVTYYYTAAWVGPPGKYNNPHMAAFTFEFANTFENLVARPMCFDATRPYTASFVIKCADYGLKKTDASKIQVCIRDSEPKEAGLPATNFNAVVEAMTSRDVGVALMGTRKYMLDRAAGYDEKLNPGTDGPGASGNPNQGPLDQDLP